MDNSQESISQQGRKRNRSPSTRFPEDQIVPAAAFIPQVPVDTISDPRKKACFCQVVGHTNNGSVDNRTVTEIMKMCSPRDVVKNLSFLSRQWAEISTATERGKELWNAFLEDISAPSEGSMHPKAVYYAYLHQQQTVVALLRSRVLVFNKEKRTWKSTSMSEDMQAQDYAYAVMFDGSLLCCGGTIYERDTNSAYRINEDGEVSVLPPMINNRRGHGVIAYGRKVFVFGGFGVKSIEMYDESSWSELPVKLSAFSTMSMPCLYKGQIFLCDSLLAGVRVFSPESMSLSRIAMKTHYLYMVPIVYKGCFTLICERETEKWNLETNKAEETQQRGLDFSGVSMRTVLSGDTLYVITTRACLLMNMETFQCRSIKKWRVNSSANL